KRQTRQRIVRAAARSFRCRGTEGATIGNLMRDLRLTHGGFYRHFDSKEELFTEAFGHSLEQLAGKVASVIEQTPRGGELKALIDRISTSSTPTTSLVVARLRPWRQRLHAVHPRLGLRSCGF